MTDPYLTPYGSADDRPPAAPGPVPPRPAAVVTLAMVLVAGGLVALATMAASLLTLDATTQEVIAELSQLEGLEVTASADRIKLIFTAAVVIGGLFDTGLWFLFAWLFTHGRGRVPGTVLAGINGLASLGALADPGGPLLLILGLTNLVLIAAGLVLLWRDPVRSWFRAVGAARTYRPS